MIELLLGDCLEILKELPDNSVESVVTDPPYGLSFMGKKWDYDVPSIEIWKEVIRVLKPGGHLLSFGGARTYHRMVVAIEDAGFEIRDQIQWIYGSGFPKSLNVQKAIEKEYVCRLLKNVNVVEKLSKHTLLELREEKTDSVLGNVLIPQGGKLKSLMVIGKVDGLSEMTDMFLLESEEPINLSTDILWNASSEDLLNQKKKYITLTKLKMITELKILSLLPNLNTLENICGVGSALKPANEPIVVARKPLEKGLTAAENVLKWGTGALNIGCSRVGSEALTYESRLTHNKNLNDDGWSKIGEKSGSKTVQGRWPSNCIFDEHAAEMLDQSSFHWSNGVGPSRFFYCAKSSKGERNAGLEGMPLVKSGVIGTGEGGGPMLTGAGNERTNLNQNFHPTVKPLKLMSYLIKLVTPPNGTVLDPFMGSGSTGVAAKKLGFSFIGIEKERAYFEISRRRIESVSDAE